MRCFSTSNADSVSELSSEGNSVRHRRGELNGEIVIGLINAEGVIQLLRLDEPIKKPANTFGRAEVQLVPRTDV